MTDGIKAADVLKQRHPDYYKTLCSVHMEYEDLLAQPDQMQHYVTNSGPVIK